MFFRPRLAYFSPLPPARSGISDYSAELIPHLSRFFDITLFVSQQEVDSTAFGGLSWHRLQDFKRLHEQKPYDYLIYHIGNSLEHEHIYRYALQYPGVLVLHDFVLHHFIAGITLDRGDRQGYLEHLNLEYGESAEQIAQQILSPGISAQDRYRLFMRYPMNGLLIRRSLGVVCHSEHVRKMVTDIASDMKVCRVPMGIRIPEAEPNDMQRARTELGLSQNDFIIASFGLVTPNKRIDKVLRALAKMRERYPRSRYLLVGDVEVTYPIRELVTRLNLQQSVEFIGYTSMKHFERYIQAANVCVNLRFPTAGETSAGLLRIMAAGRPVLVSDTGSFSEIDDEIVLKVGIDNQGKEEVLIERFLCLLAERSDIAEKIGASARRHVIESHSLDGCARKYRDFLFELTGRKVVEESQFPKVSVVVLNYNGTDHIDVCLSSLLDQNYPNTHIIMVDNDSPDGSGLYAQKAYPEVECILSEKNLGFARGNNLGFKRALECGADYVVALNNDVEVDRDWVAQQVQVMESYPDIGGCGSRIMCYWQRDIINSLGHEMNAWGHTWDIGFGRRYNSSRWGVIQDVVSICGCSFMIRRQVLEKVGGFDPDYFAYYDDVDLSIRIRGLGYRLVYIPGAVVYHKFSASFGHESTRKLALCTANKWRFLWSHFPLRRVFSILPRQIYRDGREALRLMRLGVAKNFAVLISAAWHFLKMFPGLVGYRFRNHWRNEHFEFINICRPTTHVPHFCAPRQDYEVVDEDANATFPSRIIMGYSDVSMGQGWFPVETGYYTEAHRWMSRRATVFLQCEGVSRGERVLQLHFCSPYAFLHAATLSVHVEEKKLGEWPVGMDWMTIQVPVPGSTSSVLKVDLESDHLFESELTGELRDVTFMVDEISLLEKNSVFLRPQVFSAALDKIRRAKTSSVSPSVLKARMTLVEFPRLELAPGAIYETSVKVCNCGDTCWVDRPLPNGGHVTLGVQLCADSGELLNGDYGRQTLECPVFPEEEVELSVMLQAPMKPGAYRVKLDMVDEGICWFEAVGSKPCGFRFEVLEVKVPTP